MKRGVTLIELLFVVGAVAILVALAVPTVRTLNRSWGADINYQLLNGLLSTAKAIAEKEGRYAGIRFQQTTDGKQYAIFIIHEPFVPYPVNPANPADPNNDAIPCIAAAGKQAVLLGANISVAREQIIYTQNISPADKSVTIMFSPTGRLVRKWVIAGANPRNLNDEYFDNDDSKRLLFREDSGASFSHGGFVIYRNDQITEPGFYDHLQRTFINVYTGRIIEGE